MYKEQKRQLLADHGREYLLWEIQAERDCGTMGVEDTAYELDIVGESLQERVDAFCRSLDDHKDAIDTVEYDGWLAIAEREYGEIVDDYC